MDELEADTLRKIQLLVPSDSSIPEMCGLLQQAWQSTLAVSVNIEEVSRDELSSRLSIGDYQVALVPLKASANTPTDILSRFTSSSTSNISAYKNPSFDSIVEGAGSSHDPQQILNRYVSAETMLLDDAVAYPLMVETVILYWEKEFPESSSTLMEERSFSGMQLPCVRIACQGFSPVL